MDSYYEALDSSGTVLFFMEEADYGSGHPSVLSASHSGLHRRGRIQLQRGCQHQRWFVLFAGDACDDGDDNTIEDVVNFNCECVGVQAVFGCTDDDACNYSPEANVDGDSRYYLGVGSIVDPCSLMQGLLPRT